MKKLIFILLTVISILSFFMLLNEAEINTLDSIKNIERTLETSYKITIPNSVTNKDQREIYTKLKETLNKYRGSIYYSRSKEENRGGKLIQKEIKYIYFNNLDYFNKLALSEGRGLRLSENESNLFLSTDKKNNPNQIGKISSINKDKVMEIHTLDKLIDDGLFDGYCYIQLPKNININDFIKDLENNLNVHSVKIYPNTTPPKYSLSYNWLVILGLYFFCMLMVVYYILKSYKSIAIKKIMGFSNISIYLSELRLFIFAQVLIQSIVTIILCFIKFEEYNKYVGLFLKDLITVYILELLILILFVSIPYIYINKIRISDMLKNKQPTREILIFNVIIKILIIILFFTTSKFIMTNFDSFKNIYSKSYKKWEQMNNYVIIPYLKDVSPDFMDNMGTEKALIEQKKMYTYLNKKGAILADFNEFLPMVREIRLKETKYPYESDNVWINPNYLKLNPIYDVNNNPINISEKENKAILLVPEKYKNSLDNIIKLHKFWHNATTIKWTTDDIKIILIKDNQPIFSYNLDVNQNQNNYVTDAFINVLTENNGQGWEYDSLLARTGNPLKIKIDNNLSIDDNLRPILKEYGFSQYVTKIIGVNEMVASESNKIKETMQLYLMIELIVFISLILVIVQSVFNFFNQYKQYIAVRYLNGYGIYNRYKEYFVLLLISWLIISTSVYILKLVNLDFQIKLTAFLLIFELILSIIGLIIFSRKNIISTIKGS